MSMIDQDIANKCKAWPFQEAQDIIKRLRAVHKGQITPGDKGYILFQTGYGPSGLPHIGTFGEVARTTMVMQAFQALQPDIPVKMICFSDDMDGLRKIPDNVPNADVIRPYVEQKDSSGIVTHDPSPLTSVPNPFDSEFESFAYHNNAKLREFLDQFGFDYEFRSSTETYKNGEFNDGLKQILEHWDAIREVVAEILGKDRQETYCPLFPIIDLTQELIDQYGLNDTPRRCILHNVKLVSVDDLEKGLATFEVIHGPLTGEVFKQHCVFDGGAKAQWRADWALRWYALDVDYEMAGVDLKSSAEIADKILRIMGGRRPAGFHYELFLDEDGQKISKSKGNGLTMEEWLTYAPHESLAYYMFQRPSSAKKLYFDIIPKAVDEYISFIEKMPEQDDKAKLDNPAWYIHRGTIPNSQHTPVSFALLLNLVSAGNTQDKDVLWGFIQQYKPEATPDNAPFLDRLVGYAIKYYEDFVLPHKSYRLPDDRERAALEDLANRLEALPADADFDALQTEVFSAGKENGYDKSELREWFQAIYQVLLGQNQGPRFGSFIEVFGVEDTVKMIRDALEGKFANAA